LSMIPLTSIHPMIAPVRGEMRAIMSVFHANPLKGLLPFLFLPSFSSWPRTSGRAGHAGHARRGSRLCSLLPPQFGQR
jgi:hypothetical protein